MPQESNHLELNAFGGVPVVNNANDPLIYHNSLTSMQQSFNQPWSGTLGWQNTGVQNYKYGIQSAASQQDFVPFDEDGDFYGNEEGEEEEAMGLEANASGQIGEEITPKLSRTNKEAAETPLVPASGIPRCESAPFLPSNGDGQTAKFLANDRAAELRAKLIAQQRASGTPTPSSSKKKVVSISLNAQPHISTPTASRDLSNHKAPESLGQRRTQNTFVNGQHDKSSNLPHILPPKVATSDADIEGLIAYGKAAADAKKTSKESINTQALEDLCSQTTTEWNGVEKAQSAIIESVPQRQTTSSASSGASELGEIREDTPKPKTAQISSKISSPTTFKGSTTKEMTTPVKSLKLSSNVKSVASDTAKKVESTDTSTSNTKIRTPSAHIKQSESGKSTAALSIDPNIVCIQPSHDGARNRRLSQEALENWRGDGQKEHTSNSHQQRTEPSEYKQDQGRGYSGEACKRNSHYQGVRQNQTFLLEHNHAYDTTAKKYNGLDNSPLATHKDEAMYSSSQGDETRRKMTTNDKIATSVQMTADGVHTVDAAPSVETPHQLTRFDPSMFASRRIFQDVTDWLELTGFDNVSHRTKRLEIHRKKKALDMQRAELEREEQLELEQHSRSMRASSVYPNMNVDTNLSSSIFSSRTDRVSPLSRMPPPPLPLKDDIGIKIKDSATQSLSRGVENDQSSRLPIDDTSSKNETSKRQHPYDSEHRPDGHTNKMPRLDTGYKPQETKSLTSPAIKDESLESRISRKPEPRSAGYRRRSRSPERRRRSLSPIPRRASDTGGYSGYRRDMPRADMYPPSTSRHTSPSHRNSGTVNMHPYIQPNHPESQYETRTQDERESHYQRYTPNNSRGRGRGRSNSFANYRGGHKAYSSRAGMHGSVIGSDSLNLQDGGQSHK